MNRVYKYVCIAVVSVLLLGMGASLFTGDASIRPGLTLSGLLDGSYFRAYQQYYADTFAARNLMAEDFADLEAFYDFGEK